MDQAFSEDYLVTLGVHIKKKDIQIENETISLIIWDIEGKTRIDDTRKAYLLGSHAFVYVFDILRPETYENIESELNYIKKNYTNVPYSLVGNKADLFTKTFTPSFFEAPIYKDCVFTSAKTGDQVEELFKELAKKTL